MNYGLVVFSFRFSCEICGEIYHAFGFLGCNLWVKLV